LGSTGNYALTDRIATIALTSRGDLAAKALQALGELGHPSARHAVEVGLSSPDVAVRVQAANAAGRIGLAPLAGKLTALLSDDVWWVRFRAAEALAQLGKAGRDRLAAVAKQETGPAARVASLVIAERELS
jgi:HEAT repeat protein